jgi:hypothetical protein
MCFTFKLQCLLVLLLLEVIVVQLVEHFIVAEVVMGSSPFYHPYGYTQSTH